MPNWCNNTVEIYHPDPAKLKEFVDAVNEGKMCNYICPVPEDLQIVAGRVGDDTDPAQIDLEAKEKSNLAKYGVANWYDFCVANWGTKWDVDPYDKVMLTEGQKNDITIGFDSAWSPPIGIYEKMVDQGFSVRAYYYEPGMNFAGIWWDGDDDFYDLPSTSEAVREEIPAELDEMFGISECMAEYEAENTEEEEE